MGQDSFLKVHLYNPRDCVLRQFPQIFVVHTALSVVIPHNLI
jgi:hypothetical protein